MIIAIGCYNDHKHRWLSKWTALGSKSTGTLTAINQGSQGLDHPIQRQVYNLVFIGGIWLETQEYIILTQTGSSHVSGLHHCAAQLGILGKILSDSFHFIWHCPVAPHSQRKCPLVPSCCYHLYSVRNCVFNMEWMAHLWLPASVTGSRGSPVLCQCLAFYVGLNPHQPCNGS
ncbi:Hypothetical predicted protein [Podarcis lilfordi]|uniref:Uncharacterized protein n=1 Tax=Podarcis lilfordi TaxID=74358 RepID=A0AA35NXJ7_9SAUR|nr:Hypothetical predicted protein [Podarcis lilfordi]